MKPVDFELLRPATLTEALDVLAANPDDSKVLAGGQSLLPLLNFRLARPDRLVDLGRIAALGEIRRTPQAVSVGAMVRQSYAERSTVVSGQCPLLAAALPNIAHPPVRNRGTVGGSLAHADPAAELPAVATALDAVCVARSSRDSREIPAAEFFRTHLTSALRPDEILVQVRFPCAAPGTGAAFLEVGRRRGDFALVGVAVQLTVRDGVVDDCRICFSGVADTPYRAAAAEAVLTGQPVEANRTRAAADAVRDVLRPTSDLHAPAEYRKDVAGVLLERAVALAHRRATGAESEEDRNDLRTA